MSTEDDGSNDDAKDLPKAEGGERHLACPNCGHEFAADLPLDPEERQVDDTGDDNEPDNDQDEKPNTGKSRSDLVSDLNETLASLQALVASEGVAKTDEPAEAAVEKTVTPDGPSDVEKMVAASHKAQTDRMDGFEKGVSEGFELIAKSFKEIKGLIQDMPQGRKSVARILPEATGHDDAPVEKTVEERVEKAQSATDALKIQNAELWGVRDNDRGILA